MSYIVVYIFMKISLLEPLDKKIIFQAKLCFGASSDYKGFNEVLLQTWLMYSSFKKTVFLSFIMTFDMNMMKERNLILTKITKHFILSLN